MPTVPRLTSPQVRTAPLPTPQASPDAFSGPAQGVAAIGRVAGAIYEREVRKAQEVQTNDAEVQLRRMRDRLLYDQKDGALARQRQAAIDAPKEFGERWTQEQASILARVTDPEVRRRVAMRASEVRAEADAMVMRHVTGEIEKVDAETTKALSTGLLQDIVALPEDVGLVDKKMAERDALLRARMDRQGVTPEVQAIEIARERSAARVAQVSALMDREQYEAADAVASLESVQDDLQAEDKARVAKLIDEGRLVTRAQREEDRILAKYDSEAEALADARTLTGPLRDAVVNRVKARFGEQKAAKREADDQLTDAAFTRLENSGGNLAAIGGLWAQTAEVRGLRSALEARAAQLQRLESGEGEQVSWDVYTRALAMSGDELRDVNPMIEWRPYLADTEYKELTRIWSAAVEGAKAGAGNQAMEPRSVEALTFEMLRTEGIVRSRTVGQMKGVEAERYAMFLRSAREEVENLQASQKGKLTPQQKRAAIQGLLDEEVIQGRFFPKARPAAFRRPSDADAVPAFSAEAREQNAEIEDYITAAGGAVTPYKLRAIRNARALYPTLSDEELNTVLLRIARGPQ
jgi:hypothetical protein